MNAANKLLDKAREVCALGTDHALADRLGVTRQLVSQWRKGHNPLSDDRVAQLARLAREDAGPWLVAIRAEQSHGEAAKAWTSLARRLSAAASLAAVAVVLTLPASVSHASQVGEGMMHYAKKLAAAFAAAVTRRLVTCGHAPTPVLA